MSKSTLLNIALFCLANFCFSQKSVGSYSLSYFNKKYEIEASEIKNEKFSVYIQVGAEKDYTKAMIELKNSDLEEFNQFLLKMKDKYVEWSDVAKKNNVKEMTKEIELKSPSVTICWNSSKWWFSFGHKLQPSFLILDDGRMVVSIYKKATSSSNQYIDQKIYWVFSDPKEIDDLIAQLDSKKITAKLKEKETVKDLFKQ